MALQKDDLQVIAPLIRHLRGTVIDGTFRRFLFVAVVAFWLGGFTFYGSVVIPAGMKVLGGHTRQGFITQQVTDALNIAGAIATPVLIWNMAAIWTARGLWSRWTLAATLALMAAVQVELFLLHPALDRLMDFQAREIIDSARFDRLHRVYLMSATAQWCAGVLHVWFALAGPKT